MAGYHRREENMERLDVSITVNGEKEVIKVLKKLERMGYRWNNGEKPTDRSAVHHSYKEITNLDVGRGISYSVTESKIFKPVAAAEFLKEKNDCIVIYRKGDETIALNKTTGEKATAKCHPDDEYDFTTGAKLAFDRLVESTDKEIKTGDIVRIVNRGKLYTTSPQYVKELCPDEAVRYSYGNRLPDQDLEKLRLRVLAVNDSLVYMQAENYQPYDRPCFLISKSGVEKV